MVMKALRRYAALLRADLVLVEAVRPGDVLYLHHASAQVLGVGDTATDGERSHPWPGVRGGVIVPARESIDLHLFCSAGMTYRTERFPLGAWVRRQP